MCKCASFVLTKDHEFWHEKSDSHEEIIALHNLHEGVGRVNFVRVEISPANNNLSLPLSQWAYRLDENGELPEWYDAVDAEKRTRIALKKWAKAKLTRWNVKEAFKPIHPLKIETKRMSRNTALRLVKEWDSAGASVLASVFASVRTSVWDAVGDSVWESVFASVLASVGDAVGDSVRASVGDSVFASVLASVRAYIGSLFVPRITEWKYAEKLGPNPWKPLRELWVRGYVPSCDGTTWRLHAGKDAKAVFEFTKEEVKGK